VELVQKTLGTPASVLILLRTQRASAVAARYSDQQATDVAMAKHLFSRRHFATGATSSLEFPYQGGRAEIGAVNGRTGIAGGCRMAMRAMQVALDELLTNAMCMARSR
jgi:hypothetical protein